MKKVALLPVFLCILFWSFLLFPFNTSFAQTQLDAAADEVLVKYKSQRLSDEERVAMHREFGEIERQHISQIDVSVLKVRSGEVHDALSRMNRDPRIDYAEPNYKAYAFEMTNDPFLLSNNQWGIVKIQAAGSDESAWNYSKGSSTVKLGIMDTGIDQDHEDLKSKIAGNKNCSNSYTVDDRYGHGTHVAGIAAAATQNAIGIAGVGFETSLVNIKVLGDDGSGLYSWMIECLVWAADNGIPIVNLSLGGSSHSQALQDAVNYVWNKGVVIIVAAGNGGNTRPSYPAYYEQVLAVAATDVNDKKASFSSYGTWVDIAAPGTSIYSTLPNHQNAIGKRNYGLLSGTSMATPFVSGLASILSGIGNFSNTDIVRYILENTDRVSGTGTYWNSGRINALASVKAALQLTNVTPTPIMSPSITPTSTPRPVASITSSPAKKKYPPWVCQRYPYLCN